MNTLLVTSIQDSTGKTAVTIALGLLAQERGLDVGYMKPKGTRLQSNVGKTLDRDPMLARELLGLDAEMHQMEPIVYSPTFVDGAIRGQEDGQELAEIVREYYDQLADDSDLMLVEGAGRYTTGGIIDLDDPAVAELLDADVLLVADYGKPADVDEVLAAADDFGDRLAGVMFNRVADAAFDELETDVVPFLENRGVTVLGVLPRKRELAGVTIEGLADELGAEVATDAPTDAFVERFLVGAMSGDSALRYFRRTKDAAVITGGDRSEIHTAALEAPGVKCLILTGGLRPPSAVLGRAEEKGVPVLLVNADTLTTIERAEGVVRGGRTRDEHTVTLLRDLLFEHADVDALIGAADAAED
ncbi:phosphotransacetylase family protein [Halegenticoccus soli]|uniref:phosphotransacetylase family protein n=1 Tax=Halegenticoccus soli TaxID=1985678 RepID=UPI000C6EEB52|nr:phosphotransacetylase family protein [Halegenticoccus soli]